MPHTNPLVATAELGQSLWLDYIQRSMFESGELDRYIGCLLYTSPSPRD